MAATVGSSRRGTLASGRWCLAAVLAAQLLLFLPALTSPGLIRAPLPKISEATSETYPWNIFWRDEVRAGRFPLWNSLSFGGTPFVGDPQAQTFYPSHALWLVMPPDLAFKLTLLLHVWLGSWLMYRLVRELGANRFGASVSGLAYGLQGQAIVFAYAGWLQVLAPMAWAPGVVWLTCRALRDTRRWPGGLMAVAGIVLGVQILSGHPEWVRYTLIITAIVVAGAGSLRRSWSQRAVIFAGIVAIGLLVGAPQLLPTAQATLHSGSGQGALATGALQKGSSLPPLSLPTIVAPRLFGPWDLSLTTDGLVHKLSGSLVSFGETLIYVGVLPLLLVCLPGGESFRVRPRVWFFIAATGMVFALNDWTHAQSLVDAVIPFDAAFRSPGRFVFLTNFALVVLAGLGASVLGSPEVASRARRVGRAAAAGAAVLAGVSGALFWFRAPVVRLVLARVHLTPSVLATVLARPETPATLGGWAVAHAALSLAVASLLLAVSGAAVFWTSNRLTPLRQAALLVILAVDLGMFAYPFLSSVVTTDAAYRQDRLVLAPVIGQADARVGAAAGDLFESGDNANILWGVRSLNGYDRFHLAGWDRLMTVLAGSSPDALGAAGVTHAIERQPGGSLALRALVSTRGRAWWSDDTHVADSAESAARLLPSIGLGGGVVLERAAAISEHASAPPATAEVVIDRDVPGDIGLHLRAPRAGWVVVTEAMYPGWTATVNGATTSVSRAFGLFQAIHVPAGEVRVELRFRPRVVWWGVAGFLAGLFVSILLTIATKKPVVPAETAAD